MKRVITNQRLVVTTVLVFFAIAGYCVWSPGIDLRDGRHDLRSNGIWMQHGWLGGDGWFKRNKKDATLFRSKESLLASAAELRANHIRDLYPHLCPCSKTGEIAPSDSAQVERFLDAFKGFRVMPWVGGVNGSDAMVSDAKWRSTFVQSCVLFLEEHPRLAGVHVNIEPVRSGSKDYLLLLDEMKQNLPPGKLLSIAAYPPPTRWQPSQDVHWDETYSREVARRVDQASVMMYDTSLRLPKFYQELMRDWTQKVLIWYAGREVLLGVPAYEDPGVGYHDAQTENISNSLSGIHAGLNSPMQENYRGVCIYSEWEMTPGKWEEFREKFCTRN